MVAVFAGAAAPSLPARADDDDVVRSAFLFNVAKYVEWPAASFASADAPLVIGVIEDAALAEAFAVALSDKRIESRAIEVRTVASVDEARGCHVVFGSRDQRTLARSIAHDLRGEPVLSIAEYDRFARVGGMIGIEIDRGKVSFEVSRSEADRSGLKVSSKLLRLASAVR
ncbi:MAG: YfiR family protein [Myxococcota bacterium]|nr:YfiR family protein [Myxococcales bacterium]